MPKKKIKRQNQGSLKNIKGNQPNTAETPLTFDLSDGNWLKSVSLSKRYTNLLKNEDMFGKYITELFHRVIPYIQKYGLQMIKEAGTRGWKHCHPIDEEKLDLVKKIIEEIHGDLPKFEDKAGPALWQFGITQNIRMIAVYDYKINVIKPLFIDYHHLIYPSEKHNQSNYSKYDFCPIENYQ